MEETMFSLPHEILIESDYTFCPFPGKDGKGSYITVGFGPEDPPFRGERFVRVDGIDYDAFQVRSIWVGALAQGYRQFGSAVGLFWPAIRLFENLDEPLSVARMGLGITIYFRNVSDKPQKFAVRLAGSILREGCGE